MMEQIEQVLDQRVRPYLLGHGGQVEVVSLEDGILRVRLLGHCSGCPSATITTEQIIQEEVVPGHSGGEAGGAHPGGEPGPAGAGPGHPPGRGARPWLRP